MDTVTVMGVATLCGSFEQSIEISIPSLGHHGLKKWLTARKSKHLIHMAPKSGTN